MFGYAVDRDDKVQIVNRIFEMCLYNYFLSEEELSNAIGNKAKRDKCYFIHDAGNYYIEAQTRDERRTDIIVDYLGEQFIIELKIWHGNEYNERGERQLAEYLDYYHKDKGYLLSFNETVINPPAELGRLTDARGGEQSIKIENSAV